jgi:outer membrane protein OmpA-like peptidoglycan-associated protein
MTAQSATGARTIVAPTVTEAPKVTLQRQCECGQHTLGGGECENCKQQHLSLKRATSGSNQPPAAPPIVHEVLQSSGEPLDSSTRDFMESRFGHDFSSVRVHADGRAGESARAVGALAYTVGHDIVFGAGRYVPHTTDGRALLSHELAHTIQQLNVDKGDVTLDGTLRINEPHDSLEREADRVGESVLAADAGALARPSIRTSAAGTSTLHRKPDDTVEPKDDPKRYETVYENLFVRTPGGSTPTPWSNVEADKIKKQFTDAIKKLKADKPMAFGGEIDTKTTQAEAESDIVTMDKQLRGRFPQISAPLPEAQLRSRVGIISEKQTSEDDYLKQWLSNRLYMWTDIANYGLDEKDTRFQKVLTDLLGDGEVGPLIRKLASRTGAFTVGTAGSKNVFLHRGLSELQRQAVLIHELTHFYMHTLLIEWLDTTAAARYYDEGFTEYLARKAMSADQLKEAKSYQTQVDSIETEVATYIPEDDIVRAYFLGEVWRIEGKSNVAKKAFKEQIAMDPAAKPKEEHEQSQKAPGIVEIVAPGGRYRFMNLGNESSAPKQEHIDSFQQIYKQFIENHPAVRVRFVGHASSPGSLEFNQTLSLQRAKAFYQMARDAGVPENQLLDAAKPPHFGETKPTAGNEDVRGRAFNRRVELFITQAAPSSGGVQPQVPPEEKTHVGEPE